MTTAMDMVRASREPDRLKAMDYIKAICMDFMELHGDRLFGEDPAIICGIGKIQNRSVMVIGQQKSVNFGMVKPEGYRKVLRVIKLAERFKMPVITFVDTPGASCGIEAEERGQASAIANCIMEFSKLKTPTLSVIIGEGGSGGALAIGVADRLAMLQNSIFSVISPEGCAAILWNDPSKSEAATKALKITAEELKELGLIDDVIKEPKTGAHRDKDGAIKALGNYVLTELHKLDDLSIDELISRRQQKILRFGAYKEN